LDSLDRPTVVIRYGQKNVREIENGRLLGGRIVRKKAELHDPCSAS